MFNSLLDICKCDETLSHVQCTSLAYTGLFTKKRTVGIFFTHQNAKHNSLFIPYFPAYSTKHPPPPNPTPYPSLCVTSLAGHMYMQLILCVYSIM